MDWQDPALQSVDSARGRDLIYNLWLPMGDGNGIKDAFGYLSLFNASATGLSLLRHDLARAFFIQDSRCSFEFPVATSHISLG